MKCKTIRLNQIKAGGRREMTMKEHKENLSGKRSILYIDCADGFMAVHVCPKSYNYAHKVGFYCL